MTASRSASDQPKKRAACRFVVRPKGDEWSWLVVRRPGAAADMNPCLLFERVSQQIDVLEEPARSEGNTDAAVKYRSQIDGTTLLVSRSCCDEGKRLTIAVDAIGKGQLHVCRLNQICQDLSNVLKRTIWTHVETHFEQ
jgi:hypothetical protein